MCVCLYIIIIIILFLGEFMLEGEVYNCTVILGSTRGHCSPLHFLRNNLIAKEKKEPLLIQPIIKMTKIEPLAVMLFGSNMSY